MEGAIYTYYSVSLTATPDGVFPHRNFTKLKNARKYVNKIIKYYEDQGKLVRIENSQSGQELLDSSLYFENYNIEEVLDDDKANTLTYAQIRREFLITEDGENSEW